MNTIDIQAITNWHRLSYHHPVEYRYLIDHTGYLPTTSSSAQRAWHVINNNHLIQLCTACNEHPVNWYSGTQSYRKFCSRECGIGHSATHDKRRQTNLEKYGVENPRQNDLVKEKAKRTCIEKYGVENPAQHTEAKLKAKQTNTSRHGCEHPMHRLDVQEKIKQTNLSKYGVEWNISSESSIEKKVATNLLKYGTKYSLQNEDVKHTLKQTNLARYGVEYSILNERVREKGKQTNLSKYGVEWNISSESSIEKKRLTNIQKYGVSHAHQQHMVDVLPLIYDYEWLYEQYITHNKTAEFIACELGVDGTTVCNYLRHHEIAIKYSVGFSYRCVNWLTRIMADENIHIQHALNGGEYSISGTRYKADGYCADTNTVYEFHGDSFHGNPKLFASTDLCHPYSDVSAGQLYQATVDRENIIKSLGYTLIVMWELDYITQIAL